MSLRRRVPSAPARRRRGGCAVWVVVAIIVIVIAVVVAAIANRGTGPIPPIAGPTDEPAPTETQPEWCPDIEVIAIPGSWESSPTDDPIHPTSNPQSLLLGVTEPLQADYPADRVKVYAVPYTAEFATAQDPEQMSYDASRQEGYDRTVAELTATATDCPLTPYALVGFSQGAVIAGDLAEEIALGHGPVAAERIHSVVLISDGRRVADQGQQLGPVVGGIGAEVALQSLQPLVSLVMPDASMRGARSGFGELNDRVYTICAADDRICDAPSDVVAALQRPEVFTHGGVVHASYATNDAVIPGTTVPAWTVEHLRQVIVAAGGS